MTSASDHQALYLAHRPRRFADLLGQDHVTVTLRNAVRLGKVHHAYLFCGPRGTGKTSAARILAAAVNCLEPQEGEPCGSCEPCRQIAQDRFLDLVEIDAASNRGIDEIRSLRGNANYAPSAGRNKVYIVDEVHMLTPPAWNAFLKTLEEPPAGTLFVLATTDAHSVPLTALSRCQRFDFRRVPTPLIVRRLREVCAAEGIEAEASALERIAVQADGGLRDALAALEQVATAGAGRVTEARVTAVLGLADAAAVAALTSAVDRGGVSDVLAAVAAAHRQGINLLSLTRALAGTYRDRLVEAMERGDASATEKAMAAIDLLARAEGAILRGAQPYPSLEVALLRIQLATRGVAAATAAGAAP